MKELSNLLACDNGADVVGISNEEGTEGRFRGCARAIDLLRIDRGAAAVVGVHYDVGECLGADERGKGEGEKECFEKRHFDGGIG